MSVVEQVQSEPKTKTYVLLDFMDANAPVFQQVSDGQRVQIKKIPFHSPTLRQSFQDEKGIGKTIRFKEVCKSFDQTVQIKEENIPANEPFTNTERKSLQFRFGILVTKNTQIQKYLEEHPEFEEFKGFCSDGTPHRYKLLDKESDVKNSNDDFRKRTRVAVKIMGLEDLQAAKDLLIKLNGSFFETPNSIEECQNLLIEFMDDTNDAGLDAMLEEEVKVDDKVTILIGNCINAGILSFDAEEGQVSQKIADKWTPVKAISKDKTPDERMEAFAEFLTTIEGKVLADALAKELKKVSKK